MSLAVYIGRFQPLHKGHLSSIHKALAENDKLLILVGSTNVLPNFKNPFTFEQRLALLTEETKEFGDRVIIKGIKDADSDDEWVQDVVSRVLTIEENPAEVALYCHPKDEQWYRTNLLYPVETVDMIKVSATEVREQWYTDGYIDTNVLPASSVALLTNHPDERRLAREHEVTTREFRRKVQGHPFGNPVEPVTFALIVQNNKVLVGKRKGARGNGQYGLPGGFIDADESTMDAVLRETKEELSVDLKDLCNQGLAVCLAQAVSENLDDLGVRTLGINYVFVVKPDVALEPKVDMEETDDYKWVPLMDIAEERFLLFYNHNRIVRQLLSKVGGSK